MLGYLLFLMPNRYLLTHQIRVVVFISIILLGATLYLPSHFNTNKIMLLLLGSIAEEREHTPLFADSPHHEMTMNDGPTIKPSWTQARWMHWNRDPQAIASYWQALESSSSNPLIPLELGNIYAGLGEIDQAIALWQQADSGRFWAHQAEIASIAGDQIVALDYIERALMIASTDSAVLLQAGNLFFQHREMEQAIEAYTSYLAIYQLDNLSARQKLTVQDRFFIAGSLTNRARARMSVEDEDWRLSEQDLLLASEFQPRNSRIHVRLCELYRDVGQLDKALEACMIAVELAPNAASEHYYLGRVHYSRHEFALALSAFETALSLNPKMDSAQRWLERTQNAVGD